MIKGKNKKPTYKSPKTKLQSEIIFQSASVALLTMKDEYTKERERAGILDNKAVSLITILFATLTIYVPIIPFDTIKSIYWIGSKIEFALVFAASLLLITSIVIASISFIKLIRVINLQEYRKADIDQICKEEYLKYDKDVTEKALCVHYHELIYFNSKINDKKAKNLNGCFTMAIVIFLLLLVSTIVLKRVN